MINDDSEITNISCKSAIVFLQDFANFKTFLRAKTVKKRLKEWSKVADANEGKFVLNTDVLFAL